MSASEAEVRAIIKEFLLQNFLLGKGTVQIKDSESFLESGIVDSTGVLEFVNFLQETWSINVEDEELLPDNFDSVDNLTGFVTRKMRK
jgi:acyl carrier protein